jgi:hypothetical protein
MGGHDNEVRVHFVMNNEKDRNATILAFVNAGFKVHLGNEFDGDDEVVVVIESRRRVGARCVPELDDMINLLEWEKYKVVKHVDNSIDE